MLISIPLELCLSRRNLVKIVTTDNPAIIYNPKFIITRSFIFLIKYTSFYTMSNLYSYPYQNSDTGKLCDHAFG